MKTMTDGKATTGSNTWYKRLRSLNRYEEQGVLNLNDSGLHDFLCRRAAWRLAKGAAMPGGVWIGSIPDILKLSNNNRVCTPTEMSKRIQKLSRLGFVKVFKISTTKSAFVLGHFPVTGMNKQQCVIDVAGTIDWRHPVYRNLTGEGCWEMPRRIWT